MAGWPMRILAYLNPCGIFVSYALLIVVRAEENIEDSTQRRAFQRPKREILGKQVAEEDIQPLGSAEWWNGTACEGVISYNGKDNNFSHQSTHLYVELPFPTVIKVKWYYPNRNQLFFDVLLTVHLSIFSSAINQLDAQNDVRYCCDNGESFSVAQRPHAGHGLLIHPLTPKDPYSGRTAPLTSKRSILYIYSTNTATEYFKHGMYCTFCFSSKRSLLRNSKVFGSCFIHILYTGCAKI